MFHNSRKTIGVFLERSVSEFQNRLCQGIIMVIMDRTTAILLEIRHCGNCRLTKS